MRVFGVHFGLPGPHTDSLSFDTRDARAASYSTVTDFARLRG